MEKKPKKTLNNSKPAPGITISKRCKKGPRPLVSVRKWWTAGACILTVTACLGLMDLLRYWMTEGVNFLLAFWSRYSIGIGTMRCLGLESMVILQNPERSSWQRTPNPYGDPSLPLGRSLWCLGA